MKLSEFWLEAIESSRFHLFVFRNEIWVSRGDALAFLDWVGLRLPLLGAEGFQFDGEFIYPLLECIIDASGASPEEAVKLARDVILNVPAWKKPMFIGFNFDEG